MRFRTAILLSILTAGSAMARGAPPVSQVPATAPGGTEGRAGPGNVADAIRGGNAYGLRPDARPTRSYDPAPRGRPSKD